MDAEGTAAARQSSMSRIAHAFLLGAMIASGVCVTATSAQAQIPAQVRVTSASAPVSRWLRPQNEVLTNVNSGTTLDVLDFDKEGDAYWVVLPRDLHGSRHAGWIRATSVEPYVPVPAPGGEARSSVTAPTSAPATAEDKVVTTARRDAPSASPDGAAARKTYAFEDVHFERDRFSIRREDLDGLRVAVAALKEDPSLVVSIEGHTCSLGTPAHNLALGQRRADAVKDYLVKEGVAAARLRTASVGEADAEYDNSREETRRLNRRVALVPKVQP
jgi:outer membrane protein OmpA-like peptidoglycan-associated protein